MCGMNKTGIDKELPLLMVEQSKKRRPGNRICHWGSVVQRMNREPYGQKGRRAKNAYIMATVECVGKWACMHPGVHDPLIIEIHVYVWNRRRKCSSLDDSWRMKAVFRNITAISNHSRVQLLSKRRLPWWAVNIWKVRQHFYWPDIVNDVYYTSKGCQSCTLNNRTNE